MMIARLCMICSNSSDLGLYGVKRFVNAGSLFFELLEVTKATFIIKEAAFGKS